MILSLAISIKPLFSFVFKIRFISFFRFRFLDSNRLKKAGHLPFRARLKAPPGQRLTHSGCPLHRSHLYGRVFLSDWKIDSWGQAETHDPHPVHFCSSISKPMASNLQTFLHSGSEHWRHTRIDSSFHRIADFEGDMPSLNRDEHASSQSRHPVQNSEFHSIKYWEDKKTS